MAGADAHEGEAIPMTTMRANSDVLSAAALSSASSLSSSSSSSSSGKSSAREDARRYRLASDCTDEMELTMAPPTLNSQRGVDDYDSAEDQNNKISMLYPGK
jgi:hypothetical protein